MVQTNKIAVAMSGGVDSSVAAALTVERYGKENVFGVTMRLFCYGQAQSDDKSCCSMQAINDAKTVCDHLGIKQYVVNMEKEFERTVVKNFISEYKKGHTPIPCVPCNTIIKFDYLLKKVQALGADLLATGHYARKHEIKNQKLKIKNYQLLKGVDMKKDQSYFLYGLNQKQLTHTLFPLGEMQKVEVRKIAAKLGLKTAKKVESKGICFVSEERVTDWLEGKIKNKPGNIVDAAGNVVGKHEGIVFYTVGQRKRVGGGFPEPMYVVRVDAKKNQVVIGTKKELFGKELVAEKMHWISGTPKFPLKCKAKIRYNMEDASCTIMSLRGVYTTKQSCEIATLPARDDTIRVTFTKSQRAITPGQSLVLYKGDEVLGGGIIS